VGTAVATLVARRATDLSGVRLVLAWAAYALLAAFAVAVYVPGVSTFLAVFRGMPVSEVAARAGVPWEPFWISVVSMAFVDTAIHVAVAAFIVWRRPRDAFALLTSFALVSVGILHSSLQGLIPPVDPITIVFVPATNAGILLLPFIFPDGRFVPRWGVWWWLTLVIGTEIIPFLFLPLPDAFAIRLYGIWLILLGSVVAQILRYRQYSTALQRAQAKWFMFGYLTFTTMFGLNMLLPNFLFFPHLLGANATSELVLAFAFLQTVAQRIASVMVPIAVLMAMLRWHLFAIDLIINRTLVYGALTTILVAAFALATAAVQRVLVLAVGEGSDLAIVATGLVVVGAFVPLRNSLQSVVDRFVPARALLALLFTDLVRSTDRAIALGDEGWRDLLSGYRSAVRREFARHEGREVDNAGDGFFATFRAPAQAIRSATAIRAAARDLGLQTRTGIHVGECELHGRKVIGINVITASRVMSAAAPDEILVSSTTRDLVAGSQIEFMDRGLHELKGLPDGWRLYSVSSLNS